ncbi:MAG: hypothetical protein GC159_17950 [Phycisphaera sp.]|nr:hypothetical protein [Phycisphaera sp.]
MKKLTQIATAQITHNRVDVLVGQLVCYAAALVLFVAAVIKLCTLGLDEGELIIGLLAAVACMLLMVNAGLLLPLQVRHQDNNHSED